MHVYIICTRLHSSSLAKVQSSLSAFGCTVAFILLGGMCYSSQKFISHPHILTSSHPRVLTSSHPRVLTSSHLHIVGSSHPHILASSHPHILMSLHADSITISEKSYKGFSHNGHARNKSRLKDLGRLSLKA